MAAKKFGGLNRSAYDSTMDKGSHLKLSPGELEELEGYASNYQRWLNKLQTAHQEQNLQAASAITKEMLDAFGAKVCAMTRNTAANPSQAPVTLQSIKGAATKLSAFKVIREEIRARPEHKDQGSFRVVCSFGPKRSAIHTMCGDILKVAYPLQPFDFIARGRGVEAAQHHLDYLIEKENAQYVVTIDINDCFGSAIKKKVVQLLPLPSKVAEQVLIVDDAKVVVNPTMDMGSGNTCTIPNTMELDSAARRGLPQGSSVSGLIMYRAVLGPLLGALPFADRLVQHGDDFAVPAKTMPEAEAILETLKSTLSTSPVGPLTISHHVKSLNQGVDFLGYRTIRKSKVFGGHLHKQPSPRSYRRVAQRASQRYVASGGGAESLKCVSMYSKRWRASYRLWKSTAQSRGYLWVTLITACLHSSKSKKKH